MSQAQEVLDTAVANQPKKRNYGRGCLIVFLLLALPYYWVGCHTTRLRVSEETTYALGPMTSDGKRLDYFRAMEERYYPPEMKTDDNGYRLVVRAFGANISDERHRHNFQTGEDYTEKFDSEPLRLQVYEKLGLDPNIEPTMKPIESPFRRLHEHRKIWVKGTGWIDSNVESEYQKKVFWTFDDFPMLEQWYEENTAGIDLLAEAVRKPTFFIPYVREHENIPVTESILDLERVQRAREWARAVQARANYRLGIGDIDGVIDDIITIHHIARHSGKQGFLISGLVGIAIEGMAISVGIGSNPEFPPTKEQIERLVRELDALPPRPAYHECLESERYFALAALQDQYWGINPGMMDDMFPITLLPFLGWAVDINIAMNRLNKVYDVITNPNPVENDDTKWVDQIFSGTSARPINPFPLLFVRSRTNKIMDSLINLLVSAMQAGREGWRRLECATNMQRLTLALLLYEKEHGTLPEGDWREAIRPYLGANADRYFQCPSHLRLAAGETNYAMIGGVPNGIDSPTRILIAEVTQPQRLGEGDGRLPFEKAQFGDRLDTDFDGLGSYHTGGMNTGFRSGGMRFVLESTEPEDLRAFLDGR